MKIGFIVHIDNQYPVGAETDHWSFQMDYKYAAASLKSAAIITVLATAVLASAHMAYQNPGRWMLTTISVNLVNLYLLPKVLHYGNPAMIKIALVVDLATLGSLSLGGVGVGVVHLSRDTFTLLKTYQFSPALFRTFLITGFLGYGVPLFRSALEKAHHMLNYSEEWQDRFVDLHEQFQFMPEVGLGFLQTNLWQSFLLILSLLKPEHILSFCQTFDINPPGYIWAMAAAGDQVTLNQFRMTIMGMEQMADMYRLQGTPLPAEMQDGFRMRLKIALRTMKKEEQREGIYLLLSNGSKLIPDVLSNSQFLDLFVADALDATNASLKEFIGLMNSWDDLTSRHQQFSVNIIQFEQDMQTQNMQNLTLDEEEAFSQRHKELNQEFVELRKEVEKVYLNKRIWQDFAPIWNAQQELPFNESDTLLDILHDQDLLKEIEETYRSLIGTGQAPNQTLSDRLQYITSKLVSLHEDDEEEDPVSAIIFLAANKGFIKKDYENLQEWFNLDSANELEEAMEGIGLGTEEDLYEKDILPRQGQLSKAEICTNLRYYIEHAPKPNKLNDRIQPKDEIDKTTSAYRVIEKVTRAVFHAITSGLILVPILIYPYAGATGFVLGTTFFTLKRFGAPGTQAISDLTYAFFNNLPLGDFLHNLLTRRVFSLSGRRELANQFGNADFWGRMRILNFQILLTMFVAHSSLRYEQPIIGGFLQGIAFASEVVDLV